MKLKKRYLFPFVVACFFTIAMGTKPESKIPVPQEVFKAIIIDRAQVKTEGEKISIEGNTYFKSQHGKGVLFIEFGDVEKVTFLEPIEHKIPVKFLLKNGTELDGLLKGNNYLYGQALFGKFKLKVAEIAEITFHE